MDVLNTLENYFPSWLNLIFSIFLLTLYFSNVIFPRLYFPLYLYYCQVPYILSLFHTFVVLHFLCFVHILFRTSVVFSLLQTLVVSHLCCSVFCLFSSFDVLQYLVFPVCLPMLPSQMFPGLYNVPRYY